MVNLSFTIHNCLGLFLIIFSIFVLNFSTQRKYIKEYFYFSSAISFISGFIITFTIWRRDGLLLLFIWTIAIVFIYESLNLINQLGIEQNILLLKSNQDINQSAKQDVSSNKRTNRKEINIDEKFSKLKSLLDSGYITKEDYEKKKKDLIDSL